MCLILTTSSYAFIEEEVSGEVVENTCNLSFNFLFVKKWTGHKLIKTYDVLGRVNGTKEIGCGEDGGSWDWFWE